jgi:hypothetical protein
MGQMGIEETTVLVCAGLPVKGRAALHALLCSRRSRAPGCLRLLGALWRTGVVCPPVESLWSVPTHPSVHRARVLYAPAIVPHGEPHLYLPSQTRGSEGPQGHHIAGAWAGQATCCVRACVEHGGPLTAVPPCMHSPPLPPHSYAAEMHLHREHGDEPDVQPPPAPPGVREAAHGAHATDSTGAPHACSLLPCSGARGMAVLWTWQSC